jgi:hypothetical protein
MAALLSLACPRSRDQHRPSTYRSGRTFQCPDIRQLSRDRRSVWASPALVAGARGNAAASKLPDSGLFPTVSFRYIV